MNKAILMCRVSTEAQDYEAQISDLKKYAQSKGITECYVIATKESGYRDISEREGWLKTKEYFESHLDYDTLIVTEISRLGRRETAIAEIKEYMERNKKSLFIKDLDLHLYDRGKHIYILQLPPINPNLFGPFLLFLVAFYSFFY